MSIVLNEYLVQLLLESRENSDREGFPLHKDGRLLGPRQVQQGGHLNSGQRILREHPPLLHPSSHHCGHCRLHQAHKHLSDGRPLR